MGTRLLEFARQRRQYPETRKDTRYIWLFVAAAASCAALPGFVGLARVAIGVAHAAGLLSGQSHPVAAVVGGIAGAGPAATGALGATTSAVGAATGAAGAAATGALGATTSAVGAATGAAGAAATGALGATTSAIGTTTTTIGTAATDTLGAATGTLGAAGTALGATTGTTPFVATSSADDANALAALEQSGFVAPGDGPIWLKARAPNSMGAPCREYVQSVMVNNAAVDATAVVCKQPWGRWRVVVPPIAALALPVHTVEK
ncbi:MAG TPA: hypothetical protein VMV19_18420 [Xanthobacteraceae bacterium]|nr:hypothetical protein [Xanthobacteraceae bacterium]